MPTLDVTIRVNGEAAKHLYVEHLWRVGPIAGPLGLYMTDERGRVRNEDGDLGIYSLTGDADIRILGQNSVARILEGDSVPLVVLPVWVNTKIRDGSLIDLDTDEEKVDHFRILNLAWQNYNEETKDQAKRIEIVFPDNLPQERAFCEPMSISTGYPLIHFKGRAQGFDDRLFGTTTEKPTLVPSELSHALHFSRLDRTARGRVERDYVSFLLSDWAAGRRGVHNMGKRISSMVAYIEAMDHFSSRFSVFLRQPGLGLNVETEFVNRELSVTGEYLLKSMPQAGTMTANEVTPRFRG